MLIKRLLCSAVSSVDGVRCFPDRTGSTTCFSTFVPCKHSYTLWAYCVSLTYIYTTEKKYTIFIICQDFVVAFLTLTNQSQPSIRPDGCSDSPFKSPLTFCTSAQVAFITAASWEVTALNDSKNKEVVTCSLHFIATDSYCYG